MRISHRRALGRPRRHLASPDRTGSRLRRGIVTVIVAGCAKPRRWSMLSSVTAHRAGNGLSVWRGPGPIDDGGLMDSLVASGPASMPLTVPTNTYVTPARLGAWHRTMGANLPTRCASSHPDRRSVVRSGPH